MKKLAVFLLGLGLFSGCKIGEDNGQPARIYDFLVGVNLLNEQSSYQVGDTLWMEVDVPDKTLVDRKTGEQVVLENAAFSFNLMPVNFFEDLQSGVLFSDRLDYVASRSFERNADFPAEVTFSFGCPDDAYHLRFGIIFKHKGHFLFFLNRPEGVSQDGGSNPRQEILIGGGGCNSEVKSLGDVGLIEYVFNATDYHQAAFETLMNEWIQNESNWGPESSRQFLEQGKLVFGNKGAYFLEVQ